jgi:hypothetical protein
LRLAFPFFGIFVSSAQRYGRHRIVMTVRAAIGLASAGPGRDIARSGGAGKSGLDSTGVLVP